MVNRGIALDPWPCSLLYLSVVDGWPVGKLFVDQVNEIHILLSAIKVNNYLNEENL